MLAKPALWAVLGCLAQSFGLTSQYSQDLAIEFTKIAGAAYCSPQQISTWSCAHCTPDVTSTEMCTSTSWSWDETQAFVGRWKDSCVLSVEGTETLASAFIDLELYAFRPFPILPEICDGCSVHEGFLRVWMGLYPCVLMKLRSIGCTKSTPLFVTGHSLGAGVSSIGMMFLQRQGWNIAGSYNFGMPRTGDDVFAANFTTTFAGKFWRVTHHKDIIVQVPPPMWNFSWAYVHTGLEAFYDGNLTQGHKMCMSPEDKECSKQYWDLLFDDWGMYDHLHYLGIHFGKAGCGEALDDLDVPLQQSLLDLPPQQTLMV